MNGSFPDPAFDRDHRQPRADDVNSLVAAGRQIAAMMKQAAGTRAPEISKP
jgi:hypothetical protein